MAKALCKVFRMLLNGCPSAVSGTGFCQVRCPSCHPVDSDTALRETKALISHTHTHTCLTALFPGTTQVSRYQKGETNLDFAEARDSEWQWHQLEHMQVCTSLQTDNHANTPPLSFLQASLPFLPPNQQRQSTEGTDLNHTISPI